MAVVIYNDCLVNDKLIVVLVVIYNDSSVNSKQEAHRICCCMFNRHILWLLRVPATFNLFLLCSV